MQDTVSYLLLPGLGKHRLVTGREGSSFWDCLEPRYDLGSSAGKPSLSLDEEFYKREILYKMLPPNLPP